MRDNDIIESKNVQVIDDNLLRLLLETSSVNAQQSAPPVGLTGVIIGDLIGITDEDQTLLVNFLGNPTEAPVAALSIIQFATDDIGTQVALLFENGNPNNPLIIGKIQNAPMKNSQHLIEQKQIVIDGEAIVLTAEKEIVLKCGKSSITLTQAGKILIKGEYLSSRSTGVNRIKGGSIQLN